MWEGVDCRHQGTHDEGHIRDQGETIHIRVLTIRVAETTDIRVLTMRVETIDIRVLTMRVIGAYRHQGTHDGVCGAIDIRVYQGGLRHHDEGGTLHIKDEGGTTDIRVLTMGVETIHIRDKGGTIHIRVLTMKMGVLYTSGYAR